MFLQKNGVDVNFLHIPRTGGRYVANLLVNSGYSYSENFPASGYRHIYYKGKELLHLNLKEEEEVAKICNKEIPKIRFTIIRNPVDKFISFSRVFYSYIKLINLDWKDMENPEIFEEIMDRFGFLSGSNDSDKLELVFGLKNLGNNAYINQTEFIDDTVKVWKFEDGLDKKFVEWLNDEVGLDNVVLNEVSYKKKSYDEHDYKFSDEFKLVLKNYFKAEMKYFDYE